MKDWVNLAAARQQYSGYSTTPKLVGSSTHLWTKLPDHGVSLNLAAELQELSKLSSSCCQVQPRNVLSLRDSVRLLLRGRSPRLKFRFRRVKLLSAGRQRVVSDCAPKPRQLDQRRCSQSWISAHSHLLRFSWFSSWRLPFCSCQSASQRCRRGGKGPEMSFLCQMLGLCPWLRPGRSFFSIWSFLAYSQLKMAKAVCSSSPPCFDSNVLL